MANVTIHAGDFGKKRMSFSGNSFYYLGNWCVPKSLPGTEIATLQTATQEKIKEFGGAFAGGIIGGLLFGPLGLLGGVLLCGNKNKVTFIAVFKDGRKMLATTDAKTFKKIQSCCL